MQAGWAIRGFIGLLLLVAGNPVCQAGDSPASLIQQTSQALIIALRTNAGDFRRNPGLARNLGQVWIEPLVDFTAVSRRLAGPYWRRGTPRQRQRLVQATRSYLVYAYTNAMVRYAQEIAEVGQTMRIVRERLARDGRTGTVISRLSLKSGLEVDVAYRMRRAHAGSDWKIVDILVEGLSLVSAHRQRFAERLQEGGLDGLSSALLSRGGGVIE